jgi:hypothetical protein
LTITLDATCLPLEVQGERQLLDARQRPFRALGRHRVHVEAPLAPRSLAAEPLTVASDHAPGLPRLDGIETRLVRPRRIPFEQCGILRRTLVDVRLILRGGRLLFLDATEDELPAAVDAEARERGSLRRAKAVDALHGVRRGVGEHFVDLGRGKVVDDSDLHVEPLDREREARFTELAGLARADGAQPEGSRFGGAVRRCQASGPIFPRLDGRLGRLAVGGESEKLPRPRFDRSGRSGGAPEDVHRRGAVRVHLEARSHSGKVEQATRRRELDRRAPRRVHECLAVRDLDAVGSQFERGRTFHEHRRPTVPPEPGEATRCELYNLSVDQSLASIGRPGLFAGRCDRHPSLDRTQLRERLALADQRLFGRTTGRNDDRGGGEHEPAAPIPNGKTHLFSRSPSFDTTSSFFLGRPSRGKVLPTCNRR